MALKKIRTHRADFGVDDNRGRMVGYVIDVYHCPSADYPFSTNGGFVVNVGDCYYMAAASVTRNGTTFGASHGDFYGRDPETVFEEAMARLERSRKANTRKFSKGE